MWFAIIFVCWPVCDTVNYTVEYLVAQVLLPSSVDQWNNIYSKIPSLLHGSLLFSLSSCANTQPNTLTVHLLISLMVHIFSLFSSFVITLSVPPSGDRFWLCETCKGSDLDTVWHPRISGPRDYSQQGESSLLPLYIFWTVTWVFFQMGYSLQTTMSTCFTKFKHFSYRIDIWRS